MRILCIGSEGQLGSAFCKYAEDRKHKVSRWDIKLDPIWQDLSNNVIPNALYQLASVCDRVVFLACKVGGSKYLQSEGNKLSFLEDNLRILSNVFKVIAFETGRKMLFASSQMQNMDVPYGLVKRVGEEYCKLAGPAVNVVRWWNVYGNEPIDSKSHVISDMVHSGLTKGEIQLLSDGSETRQFIHVDDSSELIMRWCEDGIPLRSFDATSFIWVSIAQVAGIVADILKVPVKLGLPVHDIQVIKNEPREDILKYWHPSTSLYSGIEKVITYQKSLL